MRFIITKNYGDMSKEAAKVFADEMAKPNCVFGLATGATVKGMYQEIIKMYKNHQLDFSKLITFNLDEYYPIHPNNENSYHFFMKEHLFRHVNICNHLVHIPNGLANDIEKECVSYDDKIAHFGGIDVQFLGIGRNGHIGFNEPNISFEARTHIVKLDSKTIEDNSRFFNSVEDVPKYAISMGIKTIMDAKKIILLASGAEKRDALYEMIYGKISPRLPASILQLHKDVTVIADQDAVARLDI